MSYKNYSYIFEIFRQNLNNKIRSKLWYCHSFKDSRVQFSLYQWTHCSRISVVYIVSFKLHIKHGWNKSSEEAKTVRLSGVSFVSFSFCREMESTSRRFGSGSCLELASACLACHHFCCCWSSSPLSSGSSSWLSHLRCSSSGLEELFFFGNQERCHCCLDPRVRHNHQSLLFFLYLCKSTNMDHGSTWNKIHSYVIAFFTNYILFFKVCTSSPADKKYGSTLPTN